MLQAVQMFFLILDAVMLGNKTILVIKKNKKKQANLPVLSYIVEVDAL